MDWENSVFGFTQIWQIYADLNGFLFFVCVEFFSRRFCRLSGYNFEFIDVVHDIFIVPLGTKYR